MKSKPYFSIVIPLAPWRDAEILSSIKKLDYPKNKFEVIIEKGLNVCDNRNNGVKRAKGEIIVFLDDDAFIDENYLKVMEAFFKKYPEVDVLGGPQLTPESDKFFARVSGYALADAFSGPGVVNKRYKKAKLTLDANSSYITGANLTARREVFKKVSFDRSFYPGDDVNFVNLSKEKGFKVAYSPDVVIYHRRRDNLKGLVKQIFDYARVRARKNILEKSLHKGLFFVPTLFLIYLIILPTLFFVHQLFIVPLILYVALALLFSLYESIANREILAFFCLPFFFITIHLTYGVGFMYGMLSNLTDNE